MQNNIQKTFQLASSLFEIEYRAMVPNLHADIPSGTIMIPSSYGIVSSQYSRLGVVFPPADEKNNHLFYRVQAAYFRVVRATYITQSTT